MLVDCSFEVGLAVAESWAVALVVAWVVALVVAWVVALVVAWAVALVVAWAVAFPFEVGQVGAGTWAGPWEADLEGGIDQEGPGILVD